MKKKNILMIALSLCLIAIIAVGGTLAYFTDTTTQMTNVVSTGMVKIALIDETGGKGTTDMKVGSELTTEDSEGNEIKTGIGYTGIVPGDTISKRVGYSVVPGSADCYAAVMVTVKVTDMPNAALQGNLTSLQVAKDIAGLIRNEVDDGQWLYDTTKVETGDASDDNSITHIYYYRTSEAASGTSQKMLFESFTLPNAYGNAYADMDFNIEVKAAAIQAEHLDAPAFDQPVEGQEGVLEGNDTVKALHELLIPTQQTQP